MPVSRVRRLRPAIRQIGRPRMFSLRTVSSRVQTAHPLIFRTTWRYGRFTHLATGLWGARISATRPFFVTIPTPRPHRGEMDEAVGFTRPPYRHHAPITWHHCGFRRPAERHLTSRSSMLVGYGARTHPAAPAPATWQSSFGEGHLSHLHVLVAF